MAPAQWRRFLARNSGPAEVARAALESVAFRTCDLSEAMRRDWPGAEAAALRVDGGMSADDWMLQGLAHRLGAAVDRAKVAETAALGAAWLAGMRAGLYPGPAEFARAWALDRRFEPSADENRREVKYAGRLDAVRRTLRRSAGE